MHRIEIKNFGPIKHFEADINDLMFFIGAQASGKSTISKIIFFCRSLRDELLYFLREAKVDELEHPRWEDVFRRRQQKRLFEYFGSDWITSLISESTTPLECSFKFQIYLGQTEIITVQRVYHERIIIYYSNDLQKRLIHIFQEARKFKINNELKVIVDYQNFLATEAFFGAIQTELYELFRDTRPVFFIPAGRSVFPFLTKQWQQLDLKQFDYVTQLFLRTVVHLKKMFKHDLNTVIDNLGQLDTQNSVMCLLLTDKLREILKGEYRYDDFSDKEKLFYDNEKYVELSFASSGQQEVIWILHLLFKVILDNNPVFSVIEEPEAHLFPETQNQLVEFLGLFANAKPDNQLLVTTHSPYILTALNNLIYAYQVGQKNPDEVNALIAKQFWIDPRRVSAYFVENGTARSIMDEELQHINAEEIDRASDLTNSLHEQLLEVELAGESDGM